MKGIRCYLNVKGITLVEIIISMAILGIVSSMTFSILQFSSNMVKISEQEYDFQFSTRFVMQETTNIIRYSTAVFTIPKSSFQNGYLDQGWDYIGVREVTISPGVVGSEIVKFTYDVLTNQHKESILLSAKADTMYRFVFTQNSGLDDSLLNFSIQMLKQGQESNPTLEITSEVEAKNSLQVIDLSTPYDPAVAIAFKQQDRSLNVYANVAMVLDVSGSMGDGVGGQKNVNQNQTRLSILKRVVHDLFDNFAQEDNLYVSLVPFSTAANNPSPFKHMATRLAELKADITSLEAEGGTNTGDGLRRAYYQLYNHDLTIETGAISSKYVIVLVDGVTTFYSTISKDNDNFFMADGDLANPNFNNTNFAGSDPDGQVKGRGNAQDATGEAYIEAIGAYIQGFAKTYVIGFSSVTSDRASVGNIAAACGAESQHVYHVEDEARLVEVFEAIQKDIENDLWYLRGPKLY